jgi:ATP-dependent Clp protease ATP-binding subunit ClpC
MPFSPSAKRGLELALREALELRSRRIDREHVLLGVLREESRATDALRSLDVDPACVYEHVRSALRALAAATR